MRAHDIAKQADEAFEREEYRLAEMLYLRAAQTLATSQIKTEAKSRRLWDQAAKRCRRLAELK